MAKMPSKPAKEVKIGLLSPGGMTAAPAKRMPTKVPAKAMPSKMPAGKMPKGKGC